MVRGARLNPMDLRWQRFLVAEDGTKLWARSNARTMNSELASLVVREDQRGRGVGSQLNQALIAQSRGSLYLFCRSQLEGYYARFGFRAIGVQEAPPSLRMRYAIGRIITRLIVGRPVLMMKRE
jgi:N-acetylglutamate synthase-like GNAT family acetyltransferase